MRIKSKLEELHPDKQFGFTRHPNYPKQKIFVHKNDVDTNSLSVGDEIEYLVVMEANGAKAVQVDNLSQRVSVKMSGLSGLKIPERPKQEVQEAPPKQVENVQPLKIPTIQQENALHLYMPWNPGYIHDQMFLLKDIITKKGRVWIPKINSTEGKVKFNRSIIDILGKQLEEGIETCLFMTNFQCIHIWKISQIHESAELPESEVESTLVEYSQNGYQAEFWMQVTDVYVLQADHDGKLTPILQELEKLSICNLDNFNYDAKTKVTPYMSAQRYPAPVIQRDKINYFANIIKTRFAGENKTETTETLWLNTHRKVTREYVLMQEHLKKNVYPGMWEEFNLRSRHFLTEMEMLKIESAGYASLQSLQYTKQIFECYISAVLNEMDEMIGEKVRKITSGTTINEIPFKKGNYVSDSLEIFRGQGDRDYSADLPFYSAIMKCQTWRNSIHDLKNRIQKASSYREIDSIIKVTRSDISRKLVDLTDIRNWFSHGYFEVIAQFTTDSKEKQDLLVAKLTTVMNLLSSPHSEHNIFDDVYMVKTQKPRVQADLKMTELIAEIRNFSKKAAA